MQLAVTPVLTLLLLFGNTGDLVTLMNADDYFKTRGIDPTIAKLVELAGKDPVDGKTQIQQLLALRVLGENPQKFKDHFKGDSAKQLKIIEEIAMGQKAQDKLGFAREYAAWTYKQLGGRATLRPIPSKVSLPLKESALAWFPADTTHAAAMDLTQGKTPGFGQSKELQTMSKLVAKIPAKEKAEIYDAIESLGNIRVTRVAAGARLDEKKMESDGFYLRISGKANHEWLAKRLLLIAKPAAPQKKLADGETISVFTVGASQPLALIGDSDLIAASYPRPVQGPDSRPNLIDAMLSARSGKTANAHSGPLAGDIKKISAKADGFLIAALPEAMTNEILKKGSPFKAAPRSVIMEVFRQNDIIEVKFRGKMANAADAMTFSENVVKLRAQGLDELKKLTKKELDNSLVPLPVDAMKKSLESLQMRAEGDMAVGKVTLRTSLLPLPFLLIVGVNERAEMARPDVDTKPSTIPDKALDPQPKKARQSM